jgi:tetratricopeptide (TPR) repeat protein
MTTCAQAALVMLLVAVVTRASHADEMHTHDASPAIVGNVTFPISCSKDARKHIERGLAMFHSFLFDDAESQFKIATEMDASCAMAYWAEAVGLYRPLAYQPGADDMKQGWELIHKADQFGAKTQRERDYLKAAEVLYRPDARDYASRNHEYSAALKKVSSDYPDDPEASVFYALSLLTLADSDHPTDDARRAIAILNVIFAAHPDHPGVAHYIIHASDDPQLAADGLVAARQYAQIAPAAPHALHMPSHIFARLGLWQEDIESNLASLRAAQNSSAVQVGAEHQLHAMEFLEYAYLQIGEDEKAKAMIEQTAKIGYEKVDPNLHDYVNRTRANSPALYYLETRNWKGAEALAPDPSAEPYNQAITFWAHAVAAGHLHDVAAAQNAVAEYEQMLELTKNGPRAGIVKYMTTGHDEARAWLFMLQGKNDEAEMLLRKLTERQDVEGKGEIETPAREMLADMLLEVNRPAEALAEYQKSLKTDPNRFNGLYGAGNSAELLGDHTAAKSYLAQLIHNCAESDTRRPELLRAQELVAQR